MSPERIISSVKSGYCTIFKYLVIFSISMLMILYIFLNQHNFVRQIILYDANINLHVSNTTERFVTESSDSRRSTISDNITSVTVTFTSTMTSPTTIDPAELLMERPAIPIRVEPKTSNGSIVVFIFHTHHHTLAELQMHMVRKFAVNLVAIELFLDGPTIKPMADIALKYATKIFSFPRSNHGAKLGASDRNAAVVNWALRTRAKQYLSNGTAILLLDGDVFPLSTFDSVTLLNARRLVCRKHPAPWTRYCWIGFICLGAEMASSIEDFDVSQTNRVGKGYDAGGKTVEYLLKHSNASYAYMRETILLKKDSNLFWGALDTDINWIHDNFDMCDKCGPEVFVSPFSDSNAVFYHMISATSEWRFGHQHDRRRSLLNSIMSSPFGTNRNMSSIELMASVKKVQHMEKIPMFGNLTCEKVCRE